jgi:undecaprenyl diphosphate synthase
VETSAITPAQLDPARLPAHIAIIMDGNGRWAKARNLPRIEGHRSAVQAVRETVEAVAELGIPFLTLYAFSTENWQRPQEEISALMSLLRLMLEQEEQRLIANGVRLQAIGAWETMLPPTLVEHLRKVIARTSHGERLTLTLALSYGGRHEILHAARQLAKAAQEGRLHPDSLTETLFKSYLWTKDLPEPELLIRTSGEQRISNFLLWDIAYTEFYFTPVLWPDFRRQHLYEALWAYQQRERRFGRVSASS